MPKGGGSLSNIWPSGMLPALVVVSWEQVTLCFQHGVFEIHHSITVIMNFPFKSALKNIRYLVDLSPTLIHSKPFIHHLSYKVLCWGLNCT